MAFLGIVLGWILLSCGMAAIYASVRVSHRSDAKVVEVAASAVAGTLLAIAGTALLVSIIA